MVAGLLDVVGDHILKGQHSFNIQVPCTCNEVLRVRIFSGQLISNKMAAVIEVVAINQAVIADGVPAGRLHHADGASLLGRHQILPNACVSHSAATESIQITVGLKGCCRQFCSGEVRYIPID